MLNNQEATIISSWLNSLGKRLSTFEKLEIVAKKYRWMGGDVSNYRELRRRRNVDTVALLKLSMLKGQCHHSLTTNANPTERHHNSP